MLLKPQDFNIPDKYQHWSGDVAEDHIGPFFFFMQEDAPHTAFRVESHHCNAHNTLHGGVLMAFADYSLCLGANGGTSESVVTISCNNEFIAPGYVGELITAKGHVLRRGGSLVFMRCEVFAEERLLLASSAVIKRLRKVQVNPN